MESSLALDLPRYFASPMLMDTKTPTMDELQMLRSGGAIECMFVCEEEH